MAAAQGPAKRSPDTWEEVAARRRGSFYDPAKEGGRRGALTTRAWPLRGLRGGMEVSPGSSRQAFAPVDVPGGPAARSSSGARPRSRGGGPAQPQQPPHPQRAGGGGGVGELGLPEPGDQELDREQELAGSGGERQAAPRCEGSKHLQDFSAGLPSAGRPAVVRLE